MKRMGGKCKDCQGTDRLEFDHVDPFSKFKKIAALWTASQDTFWREIAKCVLRCKKCHLKRSVSEGHLLRKSSSKRSGIGVIGSSGPSKPCGDSSSLSCRSNQEGQDAGEDDSERIARRVDDSNAEKPGFVLRESASVHPVVGDGRRSVRDDEIAE